MTPERQRRVLAVAEQVLEHEPAERAAFLVLACGDDDELRREVEEVLALDATDTGFLDPPSGGDVTSLLAAERPPLAKGTRVGRYVVESVIARGGMGVVYRAMQDNPHRVVALKVLTSGFRSRYQWRRFAFEAEALGRLRHPGIAQIFEAGTHAGTEGELPFIAMEYIEGARSLSAWARDEGLDIDGRIALMLDVCEAVEHGHEREVIHRDLKPGNILVDEHGQPKVIDFGIAHAADVDPGHTTLMNEAGAIIGTLGYNSPEQLAGDPGLVDARSDVYALGVLLYELATGRRAYDLSGLGLGAAMMRVKQTVLEPASEVAPGVPPALDAIVARAMARDPQQRYAGVTELADDLRRLLERRPVEAAQRAVSVGRTWRGVAIAALVVAAVGWAVWWFGDSRDAGDDGRAVDVAWQLLLEDDAALVEHERLDAAAAKLDRRTLPDDVQRQLRARLAEAYEAAGDAEAAAAQRALGER